MGGEHHKLVTKHFFYVHGKHRQVLVLLYVFFNLSCDRSVVFKAQAI